MLLFLVTGGIISALALESFCGWARNSLSVTKHNGVMK